MIDSHKFKLLDGYTFDTNLVEKDFLKWTNDKSGSYIGNRGTIAILRRFDPSAVGNCASFEKRMGAPQILARSCSLTEW